MFLRLVLLIYLLVCASSCDFISSGRPDYSDLLTDVDAIDFSEVDVYPLFLDCNNCDTNDKQNLCFEMELMRRIQANTSEYRISSYEEIKDTVKLDILVETTGKISIAEIHQSSELVSMVPELDSILYQSVADLPAVIQPSLKRGIPVNAVFQLPIVIKTKP